MKPIPQKPGCLPKGFTSDSLLTREEFCVWQRVNIEWLKPRLDLLPGLIKESRKVIRIHPRSYLEKSTKR